MVGVIDDGAETHAVGASLTLASVPPGSWNSVSRQPHSNGWIILTQTPQIQREK
jgi:hypothetical protein